MVKRPWQRYTDTEADRVYHVLLTYLPLKHFWRIPQFFRHVRRIQTQLIEAEGLVSYSLSAEFLRKKFWTLSIWQDEKALQRFVQTKPHVETMQKLRPHMKPPKFISWSSKGTDLPPRWEEAQERMKANVVHSP